MGGARQEESQVSGAGFVHVELWSQPDAKCIEKVKGNTDSESSKATGQHHQCVATTHVAVSSCLQRNRAVLTNRDRTQHTCTICTFLIAMLKK